MPQCPAQVSFASYGTPTGHCGESNSADFRSTSKCHAMKSEVWPERLAPRTSQSPHSRTPHASTPHVRAARCTLHTPRRTPHAARRTPHAARRTPPLALWQIVLEERCLGQTTCMFVVNDDLFGGDPCVGKQKRYAGCHP
eukprot:scaffold37429_cov60-Phaeocystis_antarctica.AAC.5